MPFDSNTYKSKILSKMKSIFTENTEPINRIEETQDSINVGGLSALLNPQSVGSAIQQMTSEQLAEFGLTKNQINIITSTINSAGTQPPADNTAASVTPTQNQGQSELSDLTQPEQPQQPAADPENQNIEEPQAPVA